MVKDGISEFMNDMDGPAFLERAWEWVWVWMGTGRSEFMTI